MRLSRLSDSGIYSTSTVFECGDTIQVRINGTKVNMVFTTKSAMNTQLDKTEVDVNVTNDIEQLLQWNHYSFSFKNSFIYIHFNGNQLAAKQTLSASMNKGQFCTIGSGIDLKNNFHGHMRHLMFMHQSLNSYQSIQSQIRIVPSSSDKYLAAYFKFDKDWQSFESYQFSSKDQIVKSVTIQSSSDPENVCYCTTFPQSFLRVRKEMALKPIFLNQTMTSSNGVIDQDGIIFLFLIFPIRLDQQQPDVDQLLFSVPQYFEVRLVNKSQSIRLDIFNRSSVTSYTFKNYRFKLQSWTQYQITIRQTTAILNVDGADMDQTSYNKTIFNLNASQIVVHQPISLVYLLNSVQLNDKQNKVIFNMTFTQDMLGGQDKTFIQNGALLFESNNQLCSLADRQAPEKFISKSGDTCIDSRLYPAFGGSWARSNQTAMTGMLKSSGNTLTIEFWMKDNKIPTPFDMSSVILENAFGNDTFTQVVLVSNPQVISQKTLRVYPELKQNASQQVEWKSPNRIANNWIHIAIVNSPQSIRIVAFNHSSRLQETIQTNGISLYPYNQDIRTSIGSSLNGNNKFQGLLREFKIWSNSRTDANIAISRYTSQVSSAQLVHYFRLNSANELYTLDDAISTYVLTEKSSSLSSINWITDRELIICKPGHYFNGQCCHQFQLTGLDFQITYNPSKSLIQTQIVNTSSVNPILLNSIVANFSIVTLGFNNSTATLNQITRLFTVNRTSSFNVSSLFIDPIVFNITLQARIYSLYGPAYTSSQKTFTLQCPNFYIQMNDQAQVFQSEQLLIVSSSAESYLQLQLKSVQNTTQPRCYNPRTRSLQNITINQILWDQQLSRQNNQQSFNSVWNLSSDNTSALFNKISMQNQQWNRVSIKVYYNFVNITETSVNLTYSSVQPISNQFVQASFTRHYIESTYIDIDLSNFTSSDLLSFPNVTYRVICPTVLFSSSSDYRQLCQVNNRRFFINIQMLRKAVYAQYYQFQFLIGIQGTSIVRTITGNIMIYQDGSDQLRCPVVKYSSSYEIDKLNNNTQVIQPNGYFACSNNTLWEPISIENTIIDIRTNRPVTGLYSQPNIINNAIEQVIFKNNTNINNLIGGSQFKVTYKITVRQVNQTGPRLPINQQQFSSSYQLNVKKNNIVPQVIVTNGNRTVINPLQIGFTETNFTLNASQSFDPDNPWMQLNFIWKCPAIINDTTCRRLQTGLRNNSLVFPMVLKMQLAMTHQTNYEFGLTVSNIDNPLSFPATRSIIIRFALPLINQTVPNEMRASSCDNIDIFSNQFTKTDLNSLNNVIVYDINNWDSFSFKIQTTSTCRTPAVEYMQIYFYLFTDQTMDTISVFSQQQPPPLVESSIYSKDFPQLIKGQALTAIQGGLFVFTKRIGQNRLSMNIGRVYFQRKYASLQSIVSPQSLTIDQYQQFTLNASSSFDYENALNRNFTYEWTCPQFNDNTPPPNCLTNGPLLRITFNDRVKLSANKIQIYEYKVVVKQGDRISQPASAMITIEQRLDYSSCVTLTDNLQTSPLSYNLSQANQTFTWTRNQPVSLSYEVISSIQCDTAQIVSSKWQTNNSDIDQFWTVDSSNTNKIMISTKELNKINSGTPYSVINTVRVQLGSDSSNYFEKSNFINVKILDNNKPVLDSRQIFRYPADQSVILNVSSQNPIACKWDCPEELGGKECSNACLFNKSFVELNTIARIRGNLSVADLFGTQLDFNVTIFDGEQIYTLPKSIMLVDQVNSKDPFTQEGIESCSIKLYGQNDLQQLMKIIQTETIFYIGCNQNNLTKYLMNTNYFQLDWKVDGLNPKIDFSINSGFLIVKAYAFAKIQNSTAVISVNITNLTNRLNSRLLQDEQQVNPEDYIDPNQSQPSDNSSSSDIIDTPTNSTIDQDSSNNTDSLPQIDPNNSSSTDNSTSASNTTQNPINDNSTISQNQSVYSNNTANDSQIITPIITPPETPEVPAIVLDYNITPTLPQTKHTLLKQRFSLRSNIMQRWGNVSVSSKSGAFQFYESIFSLSFSEYETSPSQVILFQLRAEQNDLYNASSILIPLKEFTQSNIDDYYSQIALPKASAIYVDFFDGELCFIGSQDLMMPGGPLQTLTKMGTFTYNQIDKQLTILQSKVIVGFSRINNGANIEFDQDMKEILEISEYAGIGGMQDIESIIDSVVTRIISYLRSYFEYMQANLDPNNFYDKQQILINQKRVILTFFNLLKKSTASQRQIVSALSVFQAATKDFETLCYKSYEDADLIQSAVLYVQNIFKAQLASVNVANKNQYFDIIYSIINRVYQNEVKKNRNSLIKVQQTNNSRSSRTIYRVDADDNSQIVIINQNNPNEYVKFSQIESSLSAQTGIASLAVQFDVEDPNQISNAGTQSLVTIKGLDASGNIVDVNFIENSTTFFEIGFTLKTQANKTLFTKGPRNESLEVGCVYFDTKKNAWDRSGVRLAIYNSRNLQLICNSYHLSQFSAQLFIIPRQSVNTTQNQTDQKVVTPPAPNPPIIQVGGNVSNNTAKEKKFYEQNTSNYIAAVVVISILAVICPLIHVIFLRYKNEKGGGDFSDKISIKPHDSSFILKIWSVMKVYHPLVASLFAQTNPVLAIPRAFQVLSLEINLFAIVLTSLIHLLYIEQKQSAYLDNDTNKAIYAVIVIGSFWIIRNILNRVKNGMYLQYASVTEESTQFNSHRAGRMQNYIQNNNFIESPSELIGKSTVLHNSQFSLNRINDKDQEDRFDHFEGGESDTEEHAGPKSTSQVDETIDYPQVKIASNHDYQPDQHYQTHPEEEYKESQFTMQSAHDHFKINMKESSPLSLSQPFQGTPNDTHEDVEDSIQEDDQYSSNVNAEQIKIEFQGFTLKPEDFQFQGFTPKPEDSFQTRKPEVKSPSKEQQREDQVTPTPTFKLETPYEITIAISNSHCFKGTRIILFILLSAIMAAELIIIFILMRKIQNQEILAQWIILCVVFSIVWLVILDTIACLVFSIIFMKSKSIRSSCLQVMAAILVCNSDERSLLSTNLEIKGRIID